MRGEEKFTCSHSIQNLRKISFCENNGDLWVGNHARVSREKQKAGDFPPEFLKHWNIPASARRVLWEKVNQYL